VDTIKNDQAGPTGTLLLCLLAVVSVVVVVVVVAWLRMRKLFVCLIVVAVDVVVFFGLEFELHLLCCMLPTIGRQLSAALSPFFI